MQALYEEFNSKLVIPKTNFNFEQEKCTEVRTSMAS